jgi:O-antigen ligase
LPSLQLSGSSGSGLARMRLEQTIGLANPNDLGAWFGFCCVYCVIASFETKRAAVRVASWLAAGGCLYIIGLTVSRAPLLAAAIAIVVALRRLLKRSFVPVLILLILSWIVYILGIFEHIVASYAARGMEDTGRMTIWPLALERFLSSPLIGVGGAHIATSTPKGAWITPHNGFIWVALASGVVPLLFFLGYWVRAVWGVFGTNVVQRPDAPFRIPLLIYAFLIVMELNFAFMAPWVIVILSVSTGSPRRLRQVRRRDTTEPWEPWDKARYAIVRHPSHSHSMNS